MSPFIVLAWSILLVAVVNFAMWMMVIRRLAKLEAAIAPQEAITWVDRCRIVCQRMQMILPPGQEIAFENRVDMVRFYVYERGTSREHAAIFWAAKGSFEESAMCRDISNWIKSRL